MTQHPGFPSSEAKQPTRPLMETIEEALTLISHLGVRAAELKRLTDPALDAAAHAADVAARRAAFKSGNDPFAIGSPATNRLIQARREALYDLEADIDDAQSVAVRWS